VQKVSSIGAGDENESFATLMPGHREGDPRHVRQRPRVLLHGQNQKGNLSVLL
jgi:hypothetical protein